MFPLFPPFNKTENNNANDGKHNIGAYNNSINPQLKGSTIGISPKIKIPFATQTNTLTIISWLSTYFAIV
jgi:hypothetical protein